MSDAIVRYPTRKWQTMNNGVRWVRWHGFGWWTQDLRVAPTNKVVWPIRPYIRVWSSRNRRLAILLPEWGRDA